MDEVKDGLNKDRLAQMAKVNEFMKTLTATFVELRARAEKERQLSKTKELSVMETWRAYMRVEKSKELQGLLKTTSEEFERALEAKEALVARAMDDVTADEEQHKHVARIHSLALNRLLALQERRVDDLRTAMVAEVRKMKDSFEIERAEVITNHTRLRTELLHQMRAVKEGEERKMAAMEADFAQTRETLRRRALEKIHTLQTDMDAAIEILEKAFEDAHARYLSSTDQRTQDFKALSARGQHDTQLKERQRRAIKRLQEHLNFQQNRLAYLVREEDEKNRRLQEERDSIASQLADLKLRMSTMQERAMTKMKQLANAVTTATGTLTHNLDLASRILTLTAAARDLEPQTMKTTPFLFTQGPLLPVPVITAGGGAATAMRPHAGSADSAATLGPGHLSSTHSTVPLEERSTVEDMVEEPELLTNFYQRYNAALLQQLALEEKERHLAEENAQLRAAMQACLEHTAVSSDVLDKPNTLMIVNGRSSRLPAVGTIALEEGSIKQPQLQPSFTSTRGPAASITLSKQAGASAVGGPIVVSVAAR